MTSNVETKTRFFRNRNTKCARVSLEKSFDVQTEPGSRPFGVLGPDLKSPSPEPFFSSVKNVSYVDSFWSDSYIVSYNPYSIGTFSIRDPFSLPVGNRVSRGTGGYGSPRPTLDPDPVRAAPVRRVVVRNSWLSTCTTTQARRYFGSAAFRIPGRGIQRLTRVYIGRYVITPTLETQCTPVPLICIPPPPPTDG